MAPLQRTLNTETSAPQSCQEKLEAFGAFWPSDGWWEVLERGFDLFPPLFVFVHELHEFHERFHADYADAFVSCNWFMPRLLPSQLSLAESEVNVK